MVMNMARNPTVNPADAETTVEIHVLHKYSKDFYGQPMRAIACGFIRPEMKFDGIGALIARIKTDAGIASKQLDAPEFQDLKADAFWSK
ncbi:MAG: riboflavin kinase [Trebouxia sp. A1-2]|nr:MAG: riboflavin kinase [Trebouxia sp. A1-2]